MGQKKDLDSSEKQKIIKLLSKGLTHVQIAKKLGRDHRTVMKFISKGGGGRKKRQEAPRRTLTKREIACVKREMSRNPALSSAEIFRAAGLTNVPKSTRCRILRGLGQMKKMKTRPPINQKHRQKRLDWAKKYLKADFSKVLWTDEMRATLDGPDGWARGWVLDGREVPVRIKRQQGGGGVMIWAGIIKNELIGPFRVQDGVKMNSQAYCNFLDEHLLPWLRRKPAAFRKQFVFMHDNAPSHASKFSTAWLQSQNITGEHIMQWPPCSPDINCIENFWAALKRRVYANGRQYQSKNALWIALQKAAKEFSSKEIEGFTSSMDSRLVSIIEKKGGYIGY